LAGRERERLPSERASRQTTPAPQSGCCGIDKALSGCDGFFLLDGMLALERVVRGKASFDAMGLDRDKERVVSRDEPARMHRAERESGVGFPKYKKSTEAAISQEFRNTPKVASSNL
jgi:hypothetical protein